MNLLPPFSRWSAPLHRQGRASKRSPIDRFWSHVEKGDGCWVWLGRLDGRQIKYGKFDIGHKGMLAHRFSWAVANGLVPPDDLCVCHRCDNPVCVRPDHLFLGTNKDNRHDAVRKGRHARGVSHPCAKLTEKSVREIRSSRDSLRIIADRYGITEPHVRNILAGRFWRHVTEGAD